MLSGWLKNNFFNLRVMTKLLSSAILLMSFLIFFSACSKTDEQAEREDVFFDDRNGGKNGSEITIDESSVKDAETQTSVNRDSYQEADQTESDGTNVSTMYDGFGNKTERRFFYQHPILQAMVLRTSTNGQKEVLLFGHNGEVKAVPQNMVDKAMSATADELAKVAGILERRKPKDSYPGFTEPQNDIAVSTPTVSDFQIIERKSVKPEIAEQQTSENPKPKNTVQDVRSSGTEYQSEINKINPNAKKNQIAKNDKDR